MAFHDVPVLPSPKLHVAVAVAAGVMVRLVNMMRFAFSESARQLYLAVTVQGDAITTVLQISLTHGAVPGIL